MEKLSSYTKALEANFDRPISKLTEEERKAAAALRKKQLSKLPRNIKGLYKY